MSDDDALDDLVNEAKQREAVTDQRRRSRSKGPSNADFLKASTDRKRGRDRQAWTVWWQRRRDLG
jgi:hypothetical protein